MGVDRPGRAERGQTTIVMVAVVVLAMALAAGIAAVGAAAVDRSRARTAADAVALAAAAEPGDGAAMAAWYSAAGVDIEIRGDRTWAGAGSAQAAAWAVAERVAPSTAPAVVAIIARAAQLLGGDLVPLDIEGVTVWLSTDDAARFAAVATDLGMCLGESTATAIAYSLC